MKPILKHVLVASIAALFATTLAALSHAQQRQDYMRAAGTATERAYQQNDADRYAAANYEDLTMSGYQAYGYVPGPFGVGGVLPSCVTQGTYGKPLDYANCY